MRIVDFTFLDSARNRQIPVLAYIPKKQSDNFKTVLYNPGYCDQKDLIKCKSGERKWPYQQAEYLARFFTEKQYAFITIQHDLVGDTGGLETLNWKDLQSVVRKPLWKRAEINILFVIEELKKQNLGLNFDKFIIGGHSNGADIAKFFANNYPEKNSHVISLDGRRCPIDSNVHLKLLMFEANETLPDDGVIPGKREVERHNDCDPKDRQNLEWVIVKPKYARHISYRDTDDNLEEDNKVRDQVCRTITWFLDNF